jgi:RNA polymerase sigma-70 factor (ECF subfamily)
MFFKSSGKKSPSSDAALIEQFKSSGDLEYLGQLYERYMHLVYGTCLKYLKKRELSQDATMQIFEKLIVEIPKREIENFKPWLYVITKNHCLMQLRSEKARHAGKEKMIENEIIFMNPDMK